MHWRLELSAVLSLFLLLACWQIAFFSGKKSGCRQHVCLKESPEHSSQQERIIPFLWKAASLGRLWPSWGLVWVFYCTVCARYNAWCMLGAEWASVGWVEDKWWLDCGAGSVTFSEENSTSVHYRWPSTVPDTCYIYSKCWWNRGIIVGLSIASSL